MPIQFLRALAVRGSSCRAPDDALVRSAYYSTEAGTHVRSSDMSYMWLLCEALVKEDESISGGNILQTTSSAVEAQ